MEKVDVLDKGYVRLVDVMGSDLTVVNAARVSYDKESVEFDEKDERLIKFLAREKHTSPFRHAMLQFEIYSPLMVCRQHFKYLAGSSFQEASGDNMQAWNESSRRYITEEPTFYIPKEDEWRSAPGNSKQGSGGPLMDVLEYHEMGELQHVYERHIEESMRLYDRSIELGMAPEQARLFLPAYGMYVRYYWTASLQSVAHFLQQRLAHDSQVEIQEYAKAVKALAEPHFPVSIAELTN
jgi:thymidylate synthase (FAD)